MGRGVWYSNDATLILYFPIREDEIEEWDNDFAWEDVVESIQENFENDFADFERVADFWVGNEGRMILENPMCQVIIAEYCGVCSLSIVPKEECDESTWEPLQEVFQQVCAMWIEETAQEFKTTLKSAVGELYSRVGGFSNGESVYEKIS